MLANEQATRALTCRQRQAGDGEGDIALLFASSRSLPLDPSLLPVTI